MVPFKEVKASMIFWGAFVVFFMLLIGVSGLAGLQGSYIVAAAKICVWPALIMFAVSLGIMIKKGGDK